MCRTDECERVNRFQMLLSTHIRIKTLIFLYNIRRHPTETGVDLQNSKSIRQSRNKHRSTAPRSGQGVIL